MNTKISVCEIKHCSHKIYFDEECGECESGYIPVEDRTECLEAIDNLTNCLIATNTNNCFRCKEGFASVSDTGLYKCVA